MTKNYEREVQRKLRVLLHAERLGQVAKTCRYFGIGIQVLKHQNLSKSSHIRLENLTLL